MPQRPLAAKLDEAVRQVTQNIGGVSIGRVHERETWRINFTEGATPEEREAALAVLATFEPKDDPEPDEIQEQIDFIRWVMSGDEPEPVETQPLGYEDEAPDLEAENEALRQENDRLRKELEARDAPVGLPPNPAETKLSDYYIPAEIRDLMEEGETFPQARKRLSELLNVEKAELRLKRAAGSATEAELKREADVDRLQGLFSKLGEI